MVFRNTKRRRVTVTTRRPLRAKPAPKFRVVRKRRYVRKAKPTLQRLARTVRNLKLDQYEKQMWHYTWGTTTQVEITCDPIIASPTAWYRLFTTAQDSPVTQKAWLNTITYNYRYQITANTPKTYPIWITMFFVSPKWAFRQTQAATVPTNLTATQLSGDVHYAYTQDGPATVMLNKEMFYIHKVKKILLSPYVNSTLGTNIVPTEVRHAFRGGKVVFKPKMLMQAARNSSWASVPLEDLPFTRQIYCITFTKYADAFPQPVDGISLKCDHRAMYHINQVA